MTTIDTEELATIVGGTFGHRHNPRLPCIGCDFEPGAPPPLSPTFPRPVNPIVAAAGRGSFSQKGSWIGW
jgi:bacteriocin-like protein